MRITSVEGTPLFAGPAASPRQIARVTVSGADAPVAAPVRVRVEGPAVTTREPFSIEGLSPGEVRVAEVPVTIAAPHGPGSRLPVTAIAQAAGTRAELAGEITAAEPGWTIWMVCHFHYDPVWWNTQGQFAQTWLALPGEDGAMPETRPAFELVRLHLAAARDDPDYKFVLAEVDYLKPYLDAHPEHRAELGGLIAQGRVEIVGGAYNEPNTNLTSAESTIRNIVYGLGHQRHVLGADPSIAWALDAFGHDPGYPGLMAAAGLAGSAWARGPYHQWGPWRTVGGNERMQFPSEFEWISPDGRGLLTSYMANHYGAGWGLHQAADPAAAAKEALAQLSLLAPVAATRNVLLPVGADHVIPARWATTVHRDFAARYAWPRCVTGLPREFFAAVRDEAADRGIWLTPQTRDMNPVYPGKDVSHIDTKQAQRAAEVALSDGERLATLAWLAGAGYPAESLDKGWRQLVFGAHHDGITGTESDQVYLDLLGGWREAFERGDRARQAAARYLAGLSNTFPPNGGGVPGPATAAGRTARAGVPRPIAVFNTLSWPRAGLAKITLAFAGPGPRWLALRDDTGAGVPFLAEGVRRRAGGGLAEATVTFLADVPAVGYRTYWADAAPDAGPTPGGVSGEGWTAVPGTGIANETFGVSADPARGGTLTRVLDQRTGTELLRGPGNELVLQEEYDYHPRWGEGQWLLSPKGPGTGSGGAPASVRAERCPIGSRLVAEFGLGGLLVTQETLLWDGIRRAEFRTHVDGSIGQDRLLRVRFPARVPGGLPVFQCATAVVGRPFGTADMDVAQHAFTLDNPAHEWFGVGSTARVEAGGHAWAIGVAEVIVPDPGAQAARTAARDLVAALARAGVTATCTLAGGPRYGAIDLDSNLPDCRIVLGGPEENPWTARLLATLEPATAADLTARLSAAGGARVWVPAARPRAEVFAPGADVRAERDLPTLILSGGDLPAVVEELARDLAGAVIHADHALAAPDAGAGDRPLAGHSVALLNRGTPGSLVTPDGTLHIALMRASSAWPAGVWIDAPKRTVPDGSSFAWQHWSHTFRYALAAGAGDWRDAGFALAGQEYNHDLLACETDLHAGPLPGSASLCAVTTPAAGPQAAAEPPTPRPPAPEPPSPGPQPQPEPPSPQPPSPQPPSPQPPSPQPPSPQPPSPGPPSPGPQPQPPSPGPQPQPPSPGPQPQPPSPGPQPQPPSPGPQPPQPRRPSPGPQPAGLPTRPTVLLSALKPRGNPLASGRPGRPRRDAGVTARLRDGGSLPRAETPAEIRVFTGIAAAHTTDLAEGTAGPPLGVADGVVTAPVPAAGTVTLSLVPGRWRAGPEGAVPEPASPGPEDPGHREPGPEDPERGEPGPEDPERGEPGPEAPGSGEPGPEDPERGEPGPEDPGSGEPGPPEPAQPVFTRYWLHGKGPAPAGNLPVTVHLSPGRVALDGADPAVGGTPAAPARLRLTVACGPESAQGEVILRVPPGVAVRRLDGAPGPPFGYSLSPRGHACWDLSIEAVPGATPGRYFVAAQIRDDLGQLLEDVALVIIGESLPPAAGLPPGELVSLLVAEGQAQAAEVAVSLLPEAVEVAPGDPVELAVRLTNRTAAPIRGECQLISPFGSWREVRPWTRGFAAGAGETVLLRYPGAAPADARPGSRWWALAKVMYFGRLHYSECTQITVRR